MPDIINALGAATTAAKKVRELSDSLATADLVLALAELTEQLAEVKAQAVDLERRNLALTLEIEQLRADDLEFRDGVYFKAGDDGPFCAACYDTSGRLIRMVDVEKRFGKLMKYRCNVCRASA